MPENNTDSISVPHQLIVSRSSEKRNWITEIDCDSDSELPYRTRSECSVMNNEISPYKNHRSNITAAKVLIPTSFVLRFKVFKLNFFLHRFLPKRSFVWFKDELYSFNIF